jgi:hypothetical protein
LVGSLARHQLLSTESIPLPKSVAIWPSMNSRGERFVGVIDKSSLAWVWCVVKLPEMKIHSRGVVATRKLAEKHATWQSKMAQQDVNL